MKALLVTAALVLIYSNAITAEEGSTPLPAKGKAAKVDAVNFEEQLPVADTHAQALVRAAKEKRLVMTLFASSACPHCTAFRQGVLVTPEFRAFAKEKLVLVVFDITRYDAMTEFEKDMIEVLKERYQVKGTPHIVVESRSEKRLLETEGYRGAAATKVVADLEKLWAGVHQAP
jgi:thioredoxin-related protein